MKNVILMASVFVTVNVHAEPKDTDLTTAIDPGSSFVMLQDANLPNDLGPLANPNTVPDKLTSQINRSSNVYEFGYIELDSGDYASCYLYLYNKKGGPLKRDALIPNGTVFYVSKSYLSQVPRYKDASEFNLISASREYKALLSCDQQPAKITDPGLKVIDIGTMKKVLSGKMLLNYAAPERIK